MVELTIELQELNWTAAPEEPPKTMCLAAEPPPAPATAADTAAMAGTFSLACAGVSG